MRWWYLLASWPRWLIDPIRLYREARIQTIRLIGGPGDGDTYTVSLATRGIAIILEGDDGRPRSEGTYQRIDAGRFQWEEQQ